MSDKTYTIRSITDLLMVPSERRAECVKQLLLGMELAELAGAEMTGEFIWTDDGDASCSLIDGEGDAYLKLEVSRG